MNKEKNQSKRALRFILENSRPLKHMLLFSIFLTAFSACFGTVNVLVTKVLIDSAQDGIYDRLARFAVIFVAISVLQIGMFMFLRYINEKCKARLEMVMKKRIFGEILVKEYPSVRNYHSGELINMLTGDIGVISDAVTTLPTSIASVIVRLVCAFCVLVYMQWQFALIFAFAGIFIYFTTRFMRERIKDCHKQVQKKDGIVRSFWQEIIENLLIVKAFRAEERSDEKATVFLKDHYKARLDKALFGCLSTGSNHALMRAGHIFSLIYCSVKLMNRQMSFGSLTAINQLVGQVQQPFNSLSGIIPKYYSAISSAERLMELFDIENEKDSGVKIDGDISQYYKKFECIRVNSLDFSYNDTSEKVLENVGLEIKKGDFISIMGDSGIGKSTLFKLLLNIYSFQNGSIDFVFEDRTIGVCPEMRKLFAFVPQGNLLFSGSLRENLTFLSQQKTDEEIFRALSIACADGFVNELENRLDSTIGEGGVGLSEGQLQRLAVARALLSDSPILLLDEATSALDEKTEAQMLSNIKSLTDKTCLIVTHKKAALDICTRHFVAPDFTEKA